MGLDVQRFGPWRREARAFLELTALAGVAIAQPALDLLTDNAAIFVTLRSTKFETIVLTLLLVLLPPTLLWVAEVVVGLVFPPARRWTHALFAAGIAGVIAVEVLKAQWRLSPNVLILLAIPIGLAVGVLVLRFEVVRLWLRYLAIAPAIFAIIFLFFSPVTGVVFENGGAPTAKVHFGKPNRVVMIVMDEFPIESLLDGHGRIDSVLFPNFAALANTSNWYRNDATIAPRTDYAVPAILSGSYVKPQTLPVVTAYPHNLFTLLGGTYRMNVHESITHLCPNAICHEGSSATEAGGFTELLENAGLLWRRFASPEPIPKSLAFGAAADSEANALRTGERFVRSIKPATKPRLDFLHILLPHGPWHYIAGGQRQNVHGLAGTYTDNWIDDTTAQQGRQAHLLQVQAADHLLGQVLAKLRRIGAFDNSLIVLTTDHGVAFKALQNFRGASKTNYPQLMWTPLFVKAPAQRVGKVDDRRVSSIDVLPTIAEILDAKMPWKVDGHSALDAPRPDTTRKLFEWDRNMIAPPRGSAYLTFDGPAGFAEAMKGQASAATGDPALRLYRIGTYGSLIGQPARPMIDPSPSKLKATVESGDQFKTVSPQARYAPWTYISGDVDCPATPVPLAVTINGTVAGLTSTSQVAFADPPRCRYWGELAPSLFRSGSNQVGIYAVSGPPGTPVLSPVKLSGGG